MSQRNDAAVARWTVVAVALCVIVQGLLSGALLRYEPGQVSMAAALAVAAVVVLLLAYPLVMVTGRAARRLSSRGNWDTASPDTASTRVWLTSLKVALVVGTLLNLINQGGLILSGKLADLSVGLTIMNYVVPFLVASYGGLSAIWRQDNGHAD